MRLVIRPYEPSDFEKLREMYADSDEICMGIPSSYAETWIRCLSDGISIVAELNGTLVAHAVATPLNEKEVYLCIHVRRGFRGRGIGSRMVKYLTDACVRRGYERIRIVTDEKAIGFFKKMGFEVVRVGYGYEMVLPLKSDRT